MDSPYLCLKFVWRQLELAFFGAVTSVAALFDFRKENKMNEKILIKSKADTLTKYILLIASAACLFFGAIFLFSTIPYNESQIGSLYRIYIIVGHSLIILGILILLIFLALCKCELIVTENNVKGKALFGKEIVLPLYKVSSYSTIKFLSIICVATASGITKFALIQNYKEIGKVLTQQINERQENIVQTTISNYTPQPSAMDDLKKLKDLLDAGIITQEEFDAKKKQLLGL